MKIEEEKCKGATNYFETFATASIHAWQKLVFKDILILLNDFGILLELDYVRGYELIRKQFQILKLSILTT